MNRILHLTLLLFVSIDTLANETSFMQDYYSPQNGKLINVMTPCDPGCYVEIEIDGNVLSTTTSGIGDEKLYKLEDEKDKSVTINYSQEKGVYVIHVITNTMFMLNGKIEKHPIDHALSNCYLTPLGLTTSGMVSCLMGAEQAWNTELLRVFNQLGGMSNDPLKYAQIAWMKFKDDQFNWFNSAFSSKQGSKWSYAIKERRVLLIRQQVEHLQSFYKGY